MSIANSGSVGRGRSMRRIICAACKSDEVTLVSARHWDRLMNAQRALLWRNIPSSKFEQGFIDQFGEFHNREAAMQIAVAAGQNIDYKRNGGDSRILYSEGLY